MTLNCVIRVLYSVFLCDLINLIDINFLLLFPQNLCIMFFSLKKVIYLHTFYSLHEI